MAQHLRAVGCRVLTPTLPGLADGDDPTARSPADLVDLAVDLVEHEEPLGSDPEGAAPVGRTLFRVYRP